jgi:hypothetical protein
MRSIGLWAIVVLCALSGCSGKKRPFGVVPADGGTTRVLPPAQEGVSGSAGAGSEDTGTSDVAAPPPAGVDTSSMEGSILTGSTVCDANGICSCESDGGSCEPTPLCEADDPGCDPNCSGCRIEGDCVGANAANPENTCQLCDPERNADDWSNADGLECDDGFFCTVDDACQSGVCRGAPRQCDDDVGCNGIATCDEAADACTLGENACGANQLCDVDSAMCVSTCAGCAISGTCLASGAQEPGNPCRVCDPASSTTAFSVVVGRSCGSGPTTCSAQDACGADGQCQPNHLPAATPCGNSASSTCDQADLCDGNGSCLPRLSQNGSTCNDGRFCTVGDECQGGVCTPTANRNCGAGVSCDETGDVCQCQGCSIGGTCVPPGTVNPANSCQVCNPARSTSAYVGNTGASCGAAATNCSGQDTCSDQGVCLPNHFNSQTTCGSPGACGIANQCDGGGNCQTRTIDLNTDPANCGSCGHNCESGSCTRGICQPFALVSGRAGPNGVVVDANNVYWMEGTSVNRFPKGPTPGASVTASATNQAGLNSLRRSVTSNRLLWATNTQVTIANANGTSPTALAPNRSGAVVSLFVNQDTVYWSELDAAIGGQDAFSMPVAGGAMTQAGSASPAPTFYGGSGACVFYVDSEIGGPALLWRMCDGGNDLGVTFQGTGPVRGFHVDGATQYVAAEDQGLVRLSAPNNVSLVNSTGAMGDIETDDTFVYYVDGASASSSCTTSGSVSRLPKAGGAPQSIATGQGCVGQLAVDSTAVYWAEPTTGRIMKVTKP